MCNLLASLHDIFSPRRVDTSARPTSRRRTRENRKRLRNRRIKAILAGGLVFGVGATATVAAWTDTETANGSFAAGRFNIELSVDGTAWTSNPSMVFNAGNMYPGSKVYAKVLVKTTSNTTMKGDVKVSGGGIGSPGTGIGNSLAYRAVTQATTVGGMNGFTCGEASFTGSPQYVLGGASRIPLKTGVESGSTQSLSSAAASVQAYCFEVALPDTTPNDAQGSTANHTWTWKATSVQGG